MLVHLDKLAILEATKLLHYYSIIIIIRLGVRKVFSGLQASLSIHQKVVCNLQASAVNPFSSSTSISFKMDLDKFVLLFCYN